MQLHKQLKFTGFDRQKTQKVHVELWSEKDALRTVLERITCHYHINLMITRGYSSVTALYEASKRFEDKSKEGKEIHILYLGDHDPSGLDMQRSIKESLKLFVPEIDVNLIPIGLTKKQVVGLDLPPNYAKEQDARYKAYKEKHGKYCWEVDALPIEYLTDLVEQSIVKLIDVDLFEKTIDQEREDKGSLTQALQRL